MLILPPNSANQTPNNPLIFGNLKIPGKNCVCAILCHRIATERFRDQISDENGPGNDPGHCSWKAVCRARTEPKRQQGIGSLRYLFEGHAFDTERRELHRGADLVSVAPQVFDLLGYLIRNRERVVSKDELINAVWNGRSVSDAALTTRLNVARSAIGDSGEEQRLIKTLPRKGFRFVGQVREAREAAGSNSGEVAPESVLALPDKPSIAVLPFENMSGDP